MRRSGLVPPEGGPARSSRRFESDPRPLAALSASVTGRCGNSQSGMRDRGGTWVELVELRSGHATDRERRSRPIRPIDLRDTTGQAMVEFALVLPLLVMLMIGAIQFGIVFKDWI